MASDNPLDGPAGIAAIKRGIRAGWKHIVIMLLPDFGVTA
jgi:hypothetical protein